MSVNKKIKVISPQSTKSTVEDIERIVNKVTNILTDVSGTIIGIKCEGKTYSTEEFRKANNLLVSELPIVLNILEQFYM